MGAGPRVPRSAEGRGVRHGHSSRVASSFQEDATGAFQRAAEKSPNFVSLGVSSQVHAILGRANRGRGRAGAGLLKRIFLSWIRVAVGKSWKIWRDELASRDKVAAMWVEATSRKTQGSERLARAYAVGVSFFLFGLRSSA